MDCESAIISDTFLLLSGMIALLYIDQALLLLFFQDNLPACKFIGTIEDTEQLAPSGSRDTLLFINLLKCDDQLVIVYIGFCVERHGFVVNIIVEFPQALR